jgi:hypothetical protein
MMRWMRARRERIVPGTTPESGHTIMELVVSTSLLGMIVVMAMGGVVVMQNNGASTTDRYTAMQEAQTISSRITKDLRTAVSPSSTSAAFASADANDVTFYANLFDPNGPVKLHAYVALFPGTNVNVFHEDSTQADPGGTVGNYAYTLNSPVSRIDGRYLETSEPIFTYYDADGVQLATPVTTLSGLRSIAAVGVNLRVQVRPRAPVVEINTLVHVRNVDYNPNQ